MTLTNFSCSLVSPTYVLQVWYDDPESLQYKYQLARDQDLMGVAFWNVDLLDFSNTPSANKTRKDMWDAIEMFCVYNC